VVAGPYRRVGSVGGLAGGVGRGLVEDEPGVGDQAIIDDDALGTGSTFTGPVSVSDMTSDLVVTESGDHLRAGAA